MEALPEKEVIYVSAVKVHLLVESSVTLTVPVWLETVLPFAFVMFPLIAPVKSEPSAILRVSVESSPTKILPFIV